MSSLDDGRAGVRVLGVTLSVDVKRQTGVAGRVLARERHKTRRRGRPATRDLELRTRNVELRSTSNMQTDVLVAQQVVTRGNVRGDGSVDLGHVDLERRAATGHVAVLLNLEPDGARGVPGVDVLAFRDLGQVPQAGARVTHGVARGEADLGAGGDGLDRGGWAAGLLIAGHEGGGDVFDGAGSRVIVRLANELPLGGLDAVDDGLGEEV